MYTEDDVQRKEDGTGDAVAVVHASRGAKDHHAEAEEHQDHQADKEPRAQKRKVNLGLHRKRGEREEDGRGDHGSHDDRIGAVVCLGRAHRARRPAVVQPHLART